MKNFFIIIFFFIFFQPIQASENFYDLFMSGQKKEAVNKLNKLVINGDQDAKYIMENTSKCHGFYGASSMERLPTEIAITQQTKNFKNLI